MTRHTRHRTSFVSLPEAGRARALLLASMALLPALAACGGDDGASSGASARDGGSISDAPGADGSSPSTTKDAAVQGRDAASDGAASSDDAAASDDAGPSDGSTGTASPDGGVVAPSDAGVPAGWLYTKGNHVYVARGGGADPVWVGRGVNMDDLFLCGYDNDLQMQSSSPTAEEVLTTLVGDLMSAWKPTFIRVSLGMDSYPTHGSWLTSPAQYETPMTHVIDAIGANAGVYVLVTLRTDVTMVGQDPGNPEATAVPSSASDTPDAGAFPTGTDAVYQALVDSFATSPFVIFGLSNEPGGNLADQTSLVAAMSHAVGAIRAEEDKLGAPHHLVSVQGTGYTSNISFYSTTPLAYDNVVYEVHGYPPPASSYTYANIPVILGEYGDLTDSTTFYADVESKQIPNLAWDFEPYSNCAPDLVDVNASAANVTPSAWGMTVMAYLQMHAQ